MKQIAKKYEAILKHDNNMPTNQVKSKRSQEKYERKMKHNKYMPTNQIKAFQLISYRLYET